MYSWEHICWICIGQWAIYRLRAIKKENYRPTILFTFDFPSNYFTLYFICILNFLNFLIVFFFTRKTIIHSLLLSLRYIKKKKKTKCKRDNVNINLHGYYNNCIFFQGFQTRTVHWTVKERGSRFLRLNRGRTVVEPWWRHN